MDLSRRQVLAMSGLTLAGAALAPSIGRAATPRRGGQFRFRGFTPPHFDPHLTASYTTMLNLSFSQSRLLKHKAGPNVKPGTFEYEGDLAEFFNHQDDTTYVFRLRRGGRGEPKPAGDGREPTAEEVQETFERLM